ncbi:hypothetical protein Acid345_3418 [Candidatus Koribacter versatilis Ellin345]|uniref:Uncharacterized protein n=1 Tax=Koribacter versatilis (strain Ellin345) TaxID=204669 RepID=Q1IL31_KORVE|nr:hypothetical protein [Candidatus Koribacter versatilis]ABF42419.1 hypothetical protein Acid345_3418 [Candidatus Koribacter versatilis Ellin345]
MSAEVQKVDIELTGNRLVSFKDKGRAFTLEFRRLTNGDWMKYFGGISTESERDAKERIDRFDVRTPGAALVNEALIGAKGYKTRSGEDLTTVANWQRAIPYGHRAIAAEALIDVAPSQSAAEIAFDPEVQEVYLDARWGSVEPGTMQLYTGLLHRFGMVTVEHERRYNRAMSEARVVGGSRTGRTIYPGRHKLFAELYDDLVVGVAGYTVNGTALVENKALIREEMDTFHKVSAVACLFEKPEREEASAA